MVWGLGEEGGGWRRGEGRRGLGRRVGRGLGRQVVEDVSGEGGTLVGVCVCLLLVLVLVCAVCVLVCVGVGVCVGVCDFCWCVEGEGMEGRREEGTDRPTHRRIKGLGVGGEKVAVWRVGRRRERGCLEGWRVVGESIGYELLPREEGEGREGGRRIINCLQK